MYTLSFIKKSLELLDGYDGKITKTARELGIKVRTLTDWKEKRDNDMNPKSWTTNWRGSYQHYLIYLKITSHLIEATWLF